MLTPEMRERACDLRRKANAMGNTDARYTFHVGDYWNICGEVVEFLEDLLQCDGKPMAAASVNPLFEKGAET